MNRAEVLHRIAASRERRKAVPPGPWAVVPQPWDREGMTVVGRPAEKWRQGAGDPHISPLIVSTGLNGLSRAEETDEDTAKDRAIAAFIAHSWGDLRFFEDALLALIADTPGAGSSEIVVPAALDPNNPLDRRLLEFAALMKAKFIAREGKHPGKASVTHPDFDWVGEDLHGIEEHFMEEVDEWFRKKHALRHTEAAAEDIDIANMAFVDRVVRLEKVDKVYGPMLRDEKRGVPS